MEEEAEKRKLFIDENIVKAGIDLEEIKKLSENNGKSFDTLNTDELKELIEKFKNKDNKDENILIIKEKSKAKILVKENKEKKEKTKKKESEQKKKKKKQEEPKQEVPKQEVQKQEEPKQEVPKQEEKKEEPENKENNIQEKKEEKKENEIQNQPKLNEPMPNPQPQVPEKTDNNQVQAQPQTNTNIPQNTQTQPNANIPQNPQPQPAPKKELPKLNLHKGLYFLEPFNFKTASQQNNKLLDFVKNKKPIQILISEPKKEVEGGFFSKALYSYRVQCPELGSDVRRTYADFEWLRNQLNIRYPLRLTPVVSKENAVKNIGKNLKSENEENYELRKIRYLKRFIDTILNKKIFTSSPILYEFLVLDNKTLDKYKNILNKKQYELEVGLNNLITVKGEVKCALEANTINDSENVIGKAISLSDLYNSIVSHVELAVNDFNNLTIHLKNISILFNKLNKNIIAYKYTNVDDMKNSFNDLKESFEKWSSNINSQAEFFNTIIKENLNYMSLELNEINQTFKRYRDYKSEYEDFTLMVKKEKEDLINKYISGELKKDVNKGKTPNQIKINKEAFDEMFYNKNFLLIEEKKRLCTTMHYLIRDYNKLIKIHCKKIKDINENVKKTVVIDFIKG